MAFGDFADRVVSGYAPSAWWRPRVDGRPWLSGQTERCWTLGASAAILGIVAVVQRFSALAAGFHAATTILYTILLPYLGRDGTSVVVLEVFLVQMIHVYDQFMNSVAFSSQACLFIYSGVFVALLIIHELERVNMLKS